MIDSTDVNIETAVEDALEQFKSHGWSVSVLLAVSKATDRNCTCIPRIAAALQGGLGAGEVCGAVGGGVLAIGLLYGQDYPDAVGLQTEEFVGQFAKRVGAVRCIDIVGFDISSTMDGANIIGVLRLLWYFARGGKKVCNGAVSNAVQVLLEQWEDWGDI